MSDDYQDQDLWFEVQEYGTHGWATVADADTREQAAFIERRWNKTYPEMTTRVKRVRGQA